MAGIKSAEAAIFIDCSGMGELVGGGYTLLYVYYLVWYTDLGGRGVFRRLTSLLLNFQCGNSL